MSIDRLRRTVTQMRTDAEQRGDEPNDFLPVVADWMEVTADALTHYRLSGGASEACNATKAARAYLSYRSPDHRATSHTEERV